MSLYIHRYLDYWAGAIPARIHLNQHDDNVTLRLDAINTRGSVWDYIKYNTANQRWYYLIGTRPDGVELSATGTMTRVTNDFWYLTFLLNSTFTEVAGEVPLQVQIRSSYYTYHSDVYSSKLILVVEPCP